MMKCYSHLTKNCHSICQKQQNYYNLSSYIINNSRYILDTDTDTQRDGRFAENSYEIMTHLESGFIYSPWQKSGETCIPVVGTL